MDHFFYAHPIWCFRKDHGGKWGFTAGSNPDDNLPQHMEIPLTQMSHTLYRLLRKKEMFPSGSELPKITQMCYGDGYKTIKAVLFNVHPVFYDQPSMVITSYPRQRDLTILDYFHMYNNFLQLRAFISNTMSTIDDSFELDVFINNAK